MHVHDYRDLRIDLRSDNLPHGRIQPTGSIQSDNEGFRSLSLRCSNSLLQIARDWRRNHPFHRGHPHLLGRLSRGAGRHQKQHQESERQHPDRQPPPAPPHLLPAQPHLLPAQDLSPVNVAGGGEVASLLRSASLSLVLPSTVTAPSRRTRIKKTPRYSAAGRKPMLSRNSLPSRFLNPHALSESNGSA